MLPPTNPGVSALGHLRRSRPAPSGVQVYSGLCAFSNESFNAFLKASYRSIKLGPVEGGEFRTSGSGRGGGHDTATGTTSCPAQPCKISIEASNSRSVFGIGFFLRKFVGFLFVGGGFLGLLACHLNACLEA